MRRNITRYNSCKSGFKSDSVLILNMEILHEILGTELEKMYYNSELNFRACRDRSQRFFGAAKNRVTSKQNLDFVFQNFKVDLLDRNEKLLKNSTVARKLREKGNGFYRKSDFAKALEWYNVAIMFALGGDPELGLAHANRSIVLLKLGHPEEALADIESALVNDYPKPPVLEKRRKKCNEMINQRNETRDGEMQKLRNRVEDEMTERQKIREGMLQIGNPNPRIPEAANFVTIEHDEAYGRKLVVTRDVPAGTVLMVCDPYVTVLNKQTLWDTEHCHHCLKRIRRGIQCHNCVFMFYCSESCRREAEEEYHKYECPCMGYFLLEELSSIAAFRIVCKAGPKKLFQLYESQDPSFFNPKKPYGVDEGCEFGEDPYLAVYHMMAHPEQSNEGQDIITKKTHTAVALTLLLESRSTFFREIPKSQRTDFKKFLATLIGHHIDSVCGNPTCIFEMSGLDGISLEDFYSDTSDLNSLSHKIVWSKTVPFALGIYALDSLKNHSCDPNIYFVDDVTKGRKITIASRALQAGDVLCGNYDVIFMNHPLEYRQRTLKNNYYFTCQCIACVNKWPLMPARHAGDWSEVSKFCCPTCFGTYSSKERASPEFQKRCRLNEAGSWKCSSCGKQYSKKTVEELFAANIRMVEEADRFRQHNRLREAIAKLPAAIEFYQTHLCPPSYNQIAAERLCHNVTCLMFHFLGQ